MSTITTTLGFDPSNVDARYQFAVATGEKPTRITRNADGTYQVRVDGLGESNLQALVESFTIDPQVHAPTGPAPAKTAMDVLAVEPDGSLTVTTPTNGTRQVVSMADYNPLRDRVAALETRRATSQRFTATISGSLLGIGLTRDFTCTLRRPLPDLNYDVVCTAHGAAIAWAVPASTTTCTVTVRAIAALSVGATIPISVTATPY